MAVLKALEEAYLLLRFACKQKLSDFNVQNLLTGPFHNAVGTSWENFFINCSKNVPHRRHPCDLQTLCLCFDEKFNPRFPLREMNKQRTNRL